jgi:putative salt-induced outer membrane protein YdiY
MKGHAMRYSIPAALALFCVMQLAIADTISLNNGDKITGTLVEINPASVIVQTPYAGRMTIDRTAVKTLQSEKTVSITSASGPKQDRYVSPAPGDKGWVETAAFVPPPPPAPARHTSYLDLGPNWKNQLAIGVSNTTGNDETTTFAGELSFHYEKKPDEFSLKFLGAYGMSNGNQNAGLFAETAVYRHTLNDRLFLYVDDDVRYDAIKGISLLATATGGPGYKLVDQEKLKLDVRGGPGVTYLKTFDGESNIAPAAGAGLRAQYIINERVSLTHEDTYTTSLTDLDVWRIHSETALNVKLDLERGLGLKLGFHDDYENQVSAGRKNNDTRLMLSLTLDF